jgi:hypothetical protein
MPMRIATITAISLLLTLVGRTSSVGQEQVQPPKGAARILVHLRTTPDSSYRLVATALRARDYSINDSDSTDATLATDAHYVAGGLVEISVAIRTDSSGSVVEVSGVYRRLTRLLLIFSAVSPKRIAITYGGNSSRELNLWNELAWIARYLPADSVAYGMRLR